MQELDGEIDIYFLHSGLDNADLPEIHGKKVEILNKDWVLLYVV